MCTPRTAIERNNPDYTNVSIASYYHKPGLNCGLIKYITLILTIHCGCALIRTTSQTAAWVGFIY